MTKVAEKNLWRMLAGRAISFVLLSLLLIILLGAKIASAQSASSSSLIVAPSTLVLLVGEDYALSAVDATGRPVSGAEWALSTPIADFHVENGEAHLDALSAGRATLSHLRWPVRLGDHLHPFGLGPSASYRSVVTRTHSRLRDALSAPGLPSDGNSILLRGSGDRFGGLLLLERGRFRDSLLDLRAADGTESWRYRSAGRLSKNWTVNQSGDVGIVETLTKPISAALLVLNGKTGEVRYRIPFPVSSSTINGFKCTNTNILSNLRPSPAGSVFTPDDRNMYLQVEIHVESLVMANCKDKQYTVDNSLALLQMTPTADT